MENPFDLQKPLPQTIPKLALPSVIAMTLSGITNLASTLFAIPLGQNTVAAMGIVFSALSLVQAFGYTVALGGSTLLSPLLAQKNKEEIQLLSGTTLWLDGIVGVIVGLLGWLFAPAFVIYLGSPQSLSALCVAYARPLFLSAPLVCINFALVCLLRCVNRSGIAMVGSVAGGVITLGLTPLFFFILHTGIAGAGYSFLAGQGATALILFLCFRKEPLFSIKPIVQKSLLFPILKHGFSSLLRQGLFSISLILLNQKASVYGVAVVSALSVTSRVTNLLYSALLGWGQGFAPLAGYAFGEKRGDVIRKALQFSLKTAVIFMGICSVVMALWGTRLSPLLGLCFYANALVLPFIPLGVLTTMGYQSVKRPVTAGILSCLRQGICFLPLLYGLPLLWKEKGLLITGALADGITFLICLFPYIRFHRFCLAFHKKK